MEVESRRVSGTWWRHIPADGDPWWRPNESADGRWQRGEVVDGLYLADEPDTAWAEWYRVLAELAVPPARSLPRDLWQAEVDVEVADLSEPERLRAVGLDLPRPGRRQWPEFQEVGHQLHADGWPGLVALSAARPDHLILCLFRTETQIAGVSFVPPSQRHDEPPVPPRGMTM